MSSAPWTSRPPEVLDVEHLAGLAERRRHALADAVADVLAREAGPGRETAPGVATRWYGEGCLALALGGHLDVHAVRRLRMHLDAPSHATSVELVVETSCLTSCEPPLARYLARLRLRRLIRGVRVELHSPPVELVRELGQDPPQAFTVVDDA